MAHARREITRSLSIDDVLDEPVCVRGIYFNSTVQVVVRDCVGRGDPKDFEIDFYDHGDIYICPQGYDDLIKVDQDNFKSRHPSLYKEFILETEKLALQKARRISEREWDEHEYL